MRDAIEDLEARVHPVDLAGVFHHVGENDRSFHPYRKAAASRVRSLVRQSRVDREMPSRRWYVSQPPPTDHESVNSVEVVADLAAVAAEHLIPR